ncbi:hypothetical protein A1O3_06145 [Capronia epimyces CBS 606.96]|uniref:Methyltransferase n=1 Tax=Capronia epimyces CBS 606.96 TaxID=1182542 RepID=W9XP99_9EURO|nr:uncharacterized protein A1O3_06145 [Capronia epimyces CBS 606.96]EXJ82332.1 hypothetical protein A1O3_06145 [Capronia epimyces CBS 606.96]
MTTTPEPNEADSAYGGDGDGDSDRHSTVSLGSREGLCFTEEYGRRYAVFGENDCLFPSDEQEKVRLDLFSHMIEQVLGKRLHCAPVHLSAGNERVLDVGTGTGIWAIKMADLHPTCLVTGVDISEIQPVWVPPNLGFELFDVESPWTWSHPYTFIFARQLGGSIVNWSGLVRQCYGNLEPGGWVEIQQLDLEHYAEGPLAPQAGSRVRELCDLLSLALFSFRRRLGVAGHVEDLLRRHGFQNIVHGRIKVPLGNWPKDPKYKEIGSLRQWELERALEALTLKPFCKGLGWTPEKVRAFLDEVRSEIRNKNGQEKVHLTSTL